MASFPGNIVEQTQKILAGWKEIDAELIVGGLTEIGLENKLAEARAADMQVEMQEAQLTNLRIQRNALYAEVWDQVKRVRAGIKANFGDDSAQYGMVGGTRVSDRKPSTRKPKGTE
jgi:hypothetical protein